MKQGAIFTVLALVGVASSASALIITGGPTYSLPGGGSCSVSGITSTGTGATLSCTGINLSAHTNVYVGVRNDINVNGNTMTGSAPTGGSAAVFRSSSTTASSITYTSTTTVTSASGLGAPTTTSRLVLTRTAGAASVVAAGGNPGNNSNADIGHLFQMTGGSTLTLDVDVLASNVNFALGQACPAVYDPSHSTAGAGGERSKVDVGFYFSDCGDGQLDSPEQCDAGGANGTSASCCTATCTFKPNLTPCDDDGNVCTTDTCNGASAICQHPAGNGGFTCRASGGICDLTETCTGSSPACPGDAKSSALCRASAGVCDLADSCDGVGDDCPADAKSTAPCRAAAGGCDAVESCDGATDDCPADVFQASGFVCNPGSGDLCDPNETCDGSSTACPVDTIAPSGTLCRGGSGDACDPDEFCTGGVNQPCPADVLEPTSTVCRSGSGDVCDPDEFCPGLPAGSCAAEVVLPSGTVCNPGSGDTCDPDETCSGTAGDPCPADSFEPGSTVCRASGGTCDVTENCPGVADGPCPSDAKQPTSTVCRASAGVCDVVENCDGTTNNCPADQLVANGTPCSDGFFCNGAEQCQSGACADQPDPCTFSAICNESIDMCQPDTCASAPLAGCRTAAKNLLLLKNKPDTTGTDKLVWKFIKGAVATSQAEFAEPRSTAFYALCIYAGPTDVLVASMNVPPNSTKWRALGTKGFKYLDGSLSADGIQKIIVKGVVAGKTKAIVKGRGINLPMPLESGVLAMPVTTQLVNYQSGICWESNFTTFKKNTTGLFKAKNP